eukprot:Hpha_TRINITY_DN16676_c1_g4::TRINITY_DN16676_c1_g4_i1::g.182840::m.182840/K07756/IP6K, IHPK; inositol-hexakisphosphate 5-kinase
MPAPFSSHVQKMQLPENGRSGAPLDLVFTNSLVEEKAQACQSGRSRSLSDSDDIESPDADADGDAEETEGEIGGDGEGDGEIGPTLGNVRTCPSFAQLELIPTSGGVMTPTNSQRGVTSPSSRDHSGLHCEEEQLPAVEESTLGTVGSDSHLPRLGSTKSRSSTTEVALSPRRLNPGVLGEFQHKVSGHHMMFRTSDGRIAKESTQAEERFYNTLTRQRGEPAVSQFVSFVTEFKGVGFISQQDLQDLLRQRGVGGTSPGSPNSSTNNMHRGSVSSQVSRTSLRAIRSGSGLKTDDGAAGEGSTAVTSNAGAVTGEGRTFILLRDLTYGFHRPCILDIKMGVRNYGLGCTSTKRASKKRKTRETTSATLGIRLHGMKKWDSGRGEYVSMDKFRGRGLQHDTLLHTLRDFFSDQGELINPALNRILQRLEKLVSVFEQQEQFHFYTSSLLLFYDMGNPAETADVCMIDFAYTYPVNEVLRAEPRKGIPRRDEGYLLGLHNLQRLLLCVSTYAEDFVPVPPTVTPSGRPTRHLPPPAHESDEERAEISRTPHDVMIMHDSEAEH